MSGTTVYEPRKPDFPWWVIESASGWIISAAMTRDAALLEAARLTSFGRQCHAQFAGSDLT